MQLPENSNSPEDEEIRRLLLELENLEIKFQDVNQRLGEFEKLIHLYLDKQISRIIELYAIYKNQKKAKKVKRLEQKKRGKNYKESSTEPANYKKRHESELILYESEQQELRRIYKEAIVQVHPDKINHGGEDDNIKKATAITAQLNGLYKNGELEELINFYQYVILGNSNSNEAGYQTVVVDSKIRLSSLRKKKDTLFQNLNELENSYLYTILMTHEDPLTFIDELSVQFGERIQQLEKRTRTASN